jgi:hypothetical protein
VCVTHTHTHPCFTLFQSLVANPFPLCFNGTTFCTLSSVYQNSDWGFPNAPAQLATDNKHQLQVPLLHSYFNQNLTLSDPMSDLVRH